MSGEYFHGGKGWVMLNAVDHSSHVAKAASHDDADEFVSLLEQLRAYKSDLERQLSEAQQRIKEFEGGGKPVAWVRFRSDGCYDGPIMDCDRRMDGRRESGDWTPIVTTTPTANAAVAAALMKAEEICEKLAIQKLNLEESALDEDDDEMSEIYAAQASVCSTIKRSIRAIPVDTTALEELLARAVRKGETSRLVERLRTSDEIKSIVQRVIGGEK